MSDTCVVKASRRRRALFAAVAVIGSVVLVDVSVRVLRLGPPSYAARRIEPGLPFQGVRNGGVESFNYQPNVLFWSIYDPKGDDREYFPSDGKVEYRINSNGIRGKDTTAAKPPDVWRVVCLGDSFTFGEGVQEVDTYPVCMEALLAGSVPGKRVQVINAGVQAQGTVDELNWFRIGPWQFQPDVVTLGFVLNDATPRLETMRHHTEWTEGFRLSWLGRVSKLSEWVERVRWSRGQAREFLATTRASFASADWEACKRALSDFADESRRRPFRFVVVIFPVLTQLDASYPFADLHGLVRSACVERKIECIDLLDDYRGLAPESLWVHPTDQHPNERANAIAARRIAERLRGK
ncbi:MAG: SGNH/GDSL hydrolase family protein [Planctomycetota bacterium]